jgi:hypothetical protein
MRNIKVLKNLKHIFAIGGIAIVLLFSAMSPIFSEISIVLNTKFIYNTGKDTWVDKIYQHTLSPQYFPAECSASGCNASHTKVAIVRIDDGSLNYLQANNIPFGKNIYTQIVEKLEAA